MQAYDYQIALPWDRQGRRGHLYHCNRVEFAAVGDWRQVQQAEVERENLGQDHDGGS